MRCNDPLVRSFRDYGYNVIRLPSASFTPLLLLESDGRRVLRSIGPLETELPSTAGRPLPDVRTNVPVADLTVTSSKRFAGKVVADFLAPLLAAMGGGVGLSAGLSRGSDLVVSLREVYRDSVAPGEVTRYLEAGIGAASEHARRAADSNQLWLATAILKSATFDVTMGRDLAQGFKAGAPELAGAVDLHLEADTAQAGRSVVSFTGPRQLAFAFQAVKLLYEDGEYVDYQSGTGLVGYELPGDEGYAVPGQLLLDDDLVEFD
jgi:hypothetical protein